MYFLRRSLFDPQFIEIIKDGCVVEERKASLAIKKLLQKFSSREELLLWLEEEENKQIKIAAYRMLGRKSYSKWAISQKLKEKGFSSGAIQKIIDELEKMGYLSDSDYTAMVISQKIRQGYGPAYIEKYLELKKLDASLVRIEMDYGRQKEFIQKWLVKCRGKNRNQNFQFLVKRGFDLNVIKEFVNSIGKE